MSVQCRIEISVALQTLTCFVDDKLWRVFSVSTGFKGVGNVKSSEQTPLGHHIIRAKIGQNMPLNSVFIGRRPTGEIYNAELAKQLPQRDWILTRILWLSGTQQGLNRLGNVDTMQRYIYIHGTPDSEPMGKPFSHGCIRMRNADIIDLYNQVEVGCPVEILPS
jgi:L,D-transpeptidase YbiS